MEGMMRVLILAAALALAACVQETTTVASSGCAASASGEWEGMTVEATTSGPTCALAAATLVVRDANSIAYIEAAPAAQIMTLANKADSTAMQAALTDWVSSAGAATSTSLPEWPAGAQYPRRGEFDFYPSEELDRDGYQRLRERNVPIFCYVQGMESENCLTMENDIVTSAGIQTFPG